MIKIVKSDRLDALAGRLNKLWEKSEDGEVKDALSDALFPGPGSNVGPDLDDQLRAAQEMAKEHKHAWLSDNDWQGMVNMGDDMFKAAIRIASLLQREESIFEVELDFGGEIDESSALFLSGTEDTVVALLQGVIDRVS